ncbi:MAG TPA: hypothetical protein P5086_10750 [Prolixibacteraceae bacterium]|jgi:hypothetical protein|nr:hypothetical protein [Bacteroidales bacterium]HNQ37499.1 hypothetical protein [Prolixibacteraceae bacterium]HPJ77684.1 hypothetical protein [Prolixibacteraceae bacterium]HRV89778.1 hypothetical protein [Prolixibacteraceae bacterium]
MAYQVSIFLENKLGHLERVTNVLKNAGVNIRNMNLNHTANGWGILNLVVSYPELACNLLNQNGLSAALRKIAVLKMVDKAGGLDQLLKRIAKAGVNFTTAHGMVLEEGKIAFFAIDIEDIPDARERLEAVGLEIMPDNYVYGTRFM